MAAETFPIRRIPLIPLGIVLKSMNPVEVYILSQLSKRTKQVVKSLYKTRQEVCVYLGSLVNIFTRSAGENTGLFVVSSKKGSLPKPSRFPTFGIFNRNVLNGARQLLVEFNDVMNIRMGKILINLTDLENYKSVIKWVNEYYQNTRMITIHGDTEIDFGVCMWVLENIESPNRVDFLVEPIQYFPKGTLKLKVDTLTISFGRFVRLPHLQALTGSEYTIVNADVNDEDVNQFLHGLVGGSNSNLRKLRLQGYGIAVITDVLKDLNAREIENGKWNFELENGDTATVLEHCNIDILINRA